MKKGFVAFLALLLLVPMMIFASDLAISWDWMIDNPQVTGFRYQLDGENPDNWIVVDGDTTTAVFQKLGDYKEYLLYLQQTIDGENWSESVILTEYSLIEVESADSPKVDVDLDASMDDVKVAIKAPTMFTGFFGSKYYTSIGLHTGISYDTNSADSYSHGHPVYGMTVGLNNIKTFNNNKIGIGVDLDFNAIGYISGNGYWDELYQFDTKFTYQIAVVPELEFTYNKFVFDVGLLGGMTFKGNADISSDCFALTYGLKLGFDYQVTDSIRIGFDTNATKIDDLSIKDPGYSINGSLNIKYIF